MQYLRNSSTDPHFNMAFDEAVLESYPLEKPVFYLWQNAPAVIIGLNQSAYAEVNLPYLNSHGILLARRVTGGGAVYHDLQNLNYTLAGRTVDMERDLADYLTRVARALQALGVPAEVSGRNDILVEGRKCSGYAKRLYRDRMMIHGTLMYDVDLETLGHVLDTPGSKMAAAGVRSVRSRVANLKEYLPADIAGIADFQSALHALLADGDGEAPLPEGFLGEVAALADNKFRRWEWIYGHSPVADFSKKKKFPSCGTVEVRFSIRHGCLCGLRFGGDFLGGLSPEAVEKALDGIRYEECDIRQVLDTIPIGRYFDGLESSDLTGLILSMD